MFLDKHHFYNHPVITFLFSSPPSLPSPSLFYSFSSFSFLAIDVGYFRWYWIVLVLRAPVFGLQRGEIWVSFSSITKITLLLAYAIWFFLIELLHLQFYSGLIISSLCVMDECFRIATEASSDLRLCGWVDKVHNFMRTRKRICTQVNGNCPDNNELRWELYFYSLTEAFIISLL